MTSGSRATSPIRTSSYSIAFVPTSCVAISKGEPRVCIDLRYRGESGERFEIYEKCAPYHQYR